MIFWRRHYTISDETVSRRLVKARKQTVREARKMIRRGELNGEGLLYTYRQSTVVSNRLKMKLLVQPQVSVPKLVECIQINMATSNVS